MTSTTQDRFITVLAVAFLSFPHTMLAGTGGASDELWVILLVIAVLSLCLVFLYAKSLIRKLFHRWKYGESEVGELPDEEADEALHHSPH